MSNKDLQEQRAKIREVRKAEADALINANIEVTKADFAQYDGTLLNSPFSELKIDTASYDGTNNNVIEVSLDGGSTVWTTIVAHATQTSGPPFLYYRARFYEEDGTERHSVNGANASAILNSLEIIGKYDLPVPTPSVSVTPSVTP